MRDYHRAWARFFLGCDRGLIAGPRSSRKSYLVGQPILLWEAIHHPDQANLYLSETPRMGASFVNQIYSQLTREWWAPGWPGLGTVYPGLVDKKRSVKGPPTDIWFTTRRQERRDPNIRGTGVGGEGVKSYHWDRMIADDVVGTRNARTEGHRQQLADYWGNNVLPALFAESVQWRICTFHHPQDMNVRAVEHGEMPFCDEFRDVIVSGDLDAGDAVLLDPAIYKADKLKEIRTDIGLTNFALQFSNDYRAAQGAFFKRAWLEDASLDIPEGPFVKIVMDADLAYNDTDQSDFTAIAVGGKTKHGLYVALDVTRRRYDSVEGIAAEMARLYNKWKPHLHGSETGPGGMNQLHRQLSRILADKYGISGHRKLRHVPGTGKMDSAVGLQGKLQAGIQKIPHRVNSVWDAVRGELLDFPNGKHDDIVDALAYVDIDLTGARTGNAKPKSGYAVEAGWAKS